MSKYGWLSLWRHLADQTADCIARQPGVGVKRDDIANPSRYLRRRSAELHETGVRRPAEQPVQFVQFAALAFPANPSRFAGVPHPPAVEQYKAVAARSWAIALIEPSNTSQRCLQQCLIAIDTLCRSIEPVGEQSEMQLSFRARKMVHLQTPDLILDFFGRRKHCRHRDNRPQMCGHAIAQFQGRQCCRAEPARQETVHQRHSRVDGGHHTKQAEQAEPCRAETLGVQHDDRYGEQSRSDHSASANVAANAEPPAQPAGPGTRPRSEADCSLEGAASTGEKVISRIAAAILLDIQRRA